MPDDLRIRHLVEEILESRRTPEEVCSDNPDLLPAVRKRLEQVQCVGYKLDEIFPEDGPTKRDGPRPGLDHELPTIRGYEVQEILGRGGMGVVFKARQLKLNRIVALKMLLAGAYAGAEELARFQREAEAVAVLRHPNIVQVHDAGEMEGRPYLTMEYVEGGTLAQSLASTPQTPRRAAELIASLASAVQFAHQSGFIHRDLKPANVLLTMEGTPKIADFGLARSIHQSTQFTEAGARLGTPSYMAPEQAAGNASAIGPAVDIYALGAVLYEMLTGRPPLEGRVQAETIQKVIAEEPLPPSRVNRQVPRDLETICLKCLQKSPARRYASAQDLVDDLHRFLDGKPVLARPIGSFGRMVKWVRRRPTVATLLAVLLLSLGTAIVTGIFLWHQENVRQIELRHQAHVRQMETDRLRERTRQAIETPIKEAYELARAERWDDAKRILDNVPMHLADVDLDDLRQKMAQAKKDVHFGSTLEQIRLQAVYFDVEKKSFSPPFSRGVVLALHNRHEEASDSFQKACQLKATWAVAHRRLAMALERCGQLEKALAALRNCVALEQLSTFAPRRMGNILKSLGRHEEALAQFERVVLVFDPENQLREYDEGDSAETNYESARLGLAESLLCLGRFQEAKLAAAESLKLPELGKTNYQRMQRCLEIGEGLASAHGELPALYSGTKQFADLAKQLLLAEWLYRFKRSTVASVRSYESAFARPEFAGPLAPRGRGQHRFNAACAAVLAGSGRGGDAAKLTEEEKSVLRAKAKNWLTAEWEELRNGDPTDKLAAANDWPKNDDLASVRDQKALAELPIAEQKEWRALWADMKPRPLDAKVLAQARAQVDRKQWAEAAKTYALLLGDTHSIDGEIWYEHAAVQLLSGDRTGHGKSCKFMMETGQKSHSLEKVLARTQKMRGYHVARACTLAADENVDVSMAAKVSSIELQFIKRFNGGIVTVAKTT